MKRTQWMMVLTAALLVALGAQVAAYAQPDPAQSDAAKPATPPAPGPAGAPGQAAAPAAKSPFPNEGDTISYILGYNYGKGWRQQSEQMGIKLNPDLFAQSLKDGLAGTPPKMSDEEMQQFGQGLQRTMMAKRQEQGAKNLAAGKAFLEENAKKEGVKTLPSGLQYKVIKEGTGPTPKATDSVVVTYEGRLTNGEVFDSTAKHQESANEPIPVNGVIPGWTEALQLMKEGSKWQLYIPADLAYGPQGRPGIPPNSVLVFDVELRKVVPGTEPAPTVELPKQGKAAPKASNKTP